MFWPASNAETLPLPRGVTTFGPKGPLVGQFSVPEGAPAVNLMVPVRSSHAHNGLISREDFDETVDLLVAVLQSLDEEAVRSLRDYRH